MQVPRTPIQPPAPDARSRAIDSLIASAARVLPQQGPIAVFVHHNPLHEFESRTFPEGVRRAAELYGFEPYMPEDRYRDLLVSRRINAADLEAVLARRFAAGDGGEIALGMSRHDLQLDLLRFPLRVGTTVEVQWLIDEGGALRDFFKETPEIARRRSVELTRRWLLRTLADPTSAGNDSARTALASLRRQRAPENWKEDEWETCTLELLWDACLTSSHRSQSDGDAGREELSSARSNSTSTAEIITLVNGLLIPFCAAFLDQGFANWPLPARDKGFFRAFLELYRDVRPWRSWLEYLPKELARIEAAGMGAHDVIEESFDACGIAADDREGYLQRVLLALPGFAGMLSHMEHNGEWTVHPAPEATLTEYVAVRLILERVALLRQTRIRRDDPSLDLRTTAEHPPAARSSSVRRAFAIFQLAQWRGWSVPEVAALGAQGWRHLEDELESFSELDRRYCHHLAYERKYRCETLDGVLAHARRREGQGHPRNALPAYQVITCIDEREESFRRHLEEVDPSCETWGVAGFFGVAMYYRGATEAHFRPLCPVNVKPAHRVQEEPLYSFSESSQLQKRAQRRIGQMTHRLHLSSRSMLLGILTGLLGSLATVPLVLRVLFPRAVAIARKYLSTIVSPPATRLRLERTGDDSEDGLRNGYDCTEMTEIVHAILTGMGLTRRFSKIVLVVGHGSSSLNNPHEAAHDCGACGGGRGGPNARAFAEMANDSRVRGALALRGLTIPEDVIFIGAYHNTCDDSVTYYDLDRVPVSHRELFSCARVSVSEARKRNAHERCRRFRSAGLGLTVEEALQHVEGRAEDLSQTRPEYGHATNALAFVGRRSWSRGLFLDRRAFLTSYDPSQDDDDSTILGRLLGAVIPVCAGINLEYYFSFVDPTGYGCGTKLPHNITSLLGVMNGVASDLQPGLPWQMVEIHEPVRILFVIECTPDAMQRVLEGNAAIEQLVRNEWVQLATFDPAEPRIHLYRDGEFTPYEPERDDLPEVNSSLGWYRGLRDHLGFASIREAAHPNMTEESA